MVVEKNPWSVDDEKEHYPSVLEWWCTEGFISDETQRRSWSFKGSFTEWCTEENQHGSTYDFTVFDLNRKNYVSQYLRNDSKKLDVTYKDGKIFTRFDKSYLTGTFPSYSMRYVNSTENIILDLVYTSKALPHWIAQDVTDGYLPMGLGFYRYGFIPRNTVQGKLTLNGEVIPVTGTGYYEHVWGDFSYRNPISNFSHVKKSLSIYKKLVSWWIHNHKPVIPNSMQFWSENNPLGYDWVWGIFDNGWSMFLGNILFWVAEGPIFGTLILTKDGKEYKEFCNVRYRYIETKQSKHHDFEYPTGLEIIAHDSKETIMLTCESLMPTREFVTPLNQGRWKAFVIGETVGKLLGSYSDDHQKLKLSGLCKIEPQRQVSVLGHNSFSFKVIKPPKGVGLRIALDSHYLKKKINSSLIFDPLPHCSFNVKKYENSIS